MNAMGWIVYFVFLIGLMYFIAIRPQKKEKKKMQELLASVAIGDSVLTSSGMYGVVIDMTDDTVIVEFGSNKNCRIPMRKDAIVQVEKPELQCLTDEESLFQNEDSGAGSFCGDMTVCFIETYIIVDNYI